MTGRTESAASTVATACAILGNQRRLLTIKYLTLFDVGTEVDVRQIARIVRSVEVGRPPRDVQSAEYESAYNSLIQLHLPKLATEGVIEYDQDRKVIVVTQAIDRYGFFVSIADVVLSPGGWRTRN